MKTYSRIRTTRRSRQKYNFIIEDLRPYFSMPQINAAKMLKCSLSTLKRTCAKLGIRWPYKFNQCKRLQQYQGTKRKNEMTADRSVITMAKGFSANLPPNAFNNNALPIHGNLRQYVGKSDDLQSFHNVYHFNTHAVIPDDSQQCKSRKYIPEFLSFAPFRKILASVNSACAPECYNALML